MSNFNAIARTNHFLVRDVAALRAELLACGISAPNHMDADARVADLILDDRSSVQPTGSIALYAPDGWPAFDDYSVRDRLELDEDAPLPSKHDSLHALVASHLVEGQVAIFLQVGNEKMRYLEGLALAVNSAGETRSVDLDDIYGLAATLTSADQTVTRAEV